MNQSTSGDDILVRLKNALKTDGDFPASAKIVNKLKEMTNDPRTTAQQLTEVILYEPALSTRILHLVNSSFYRRAKPIMTISQAVVAVGMKSIAELCAGLVLLQRFIPLARKGGAFADGFKKAMVTSLLSSSFSAEIGGKGEGRGNEIGYISGFFLEIGPLLLAYYFPKVYESAVSRAKLKNISIEESIQQLTGYSPQTMSIEVIQALGLPAFYIEVIKSTSDHTRLAQQSIRSLDEEKIVIAGRSVGAGNTLSTAIQSEDPQEFSNALNKIQNNFGISTESATAVISGLDQVFRDHCSITEIELPELPNFIKTITPVDAIPVSESGEGSDSSMSGNRFQGYIEEIKLSVQNREPAASILTSLMEAMKFGLEFDRVMLLLFDSSKRTIASRMALGVDGFRPGGISKPVDSRLSTPESIALRDGKLVYQGDPLLENGWPFVFIPVGNLKKGLGIIYADRKDQANELSEKEKANLSIILDLVDRAVGGLK
jgi:HD-like signal output (HDOD) protein